MSWKKLINGLAPVAVVACGLGLLAAHPAPPGAFAACEFSVGPNHATCCACNKKSCITVEHNGVASCTFEFCSNTTCNIGPS